jgi:acyl-CoA reductase-like NAD-dependent aldehyde dehydrogenase
MDVQLLIGNQDIGAETGAVFERLNPVNGQLASRAAAGGVADALKAVDAAGAAFPAWATVGPTDRRLYLQRAADALAARKAEFVTAMMAETGATVAWAGFNVQLAVGMLREAACLTTQVAGETVPSDKPGCVAMAVRRPAGVVLGIAPWNAPIILGVRALATPLACGNAVVLKASEICPRTHRLIGDVFRDAGFPPGVVNVVTHRASDAASIVEALVGHPAVRRVNFTGSTRVGRIIAQLAARHLKPALLELGGKAPFLVLDDADLDEAVAAAAFGAFFNQGQICMSTERIVVEERVADAFVTKSVAKAMTLTAGDPARASAPLGAVVDPAAAQAIERLIDGAVAKGAVLHRAASPHGVLMSAAVLGRVTSQMAIYAEESFGPVVSIVRVADDDEAVRIANDTEYGLTSAVFTGDAARGLRIAERVDAGMCHINGPTVHDEAQMPFGGVKSSGYGRFGGKAAIAEFTDLRWITVETRKGHFPI